MRINGHNEVQVMRARTIERMKLAIRLCTPQYQLIMMLEVDVDTHAASINLVHQRRSYLECDQDVMCGLIDTREHAR